MWSLVLPYASYVFYGVPGGPAIRDIAPLIRHLFNSRDVKSRLLRLSHFSVYVPTFGMSTPTRGMSTPVESVHPLNAYAQLLPMHTHRPNSILIPRVGVHIPKIECAYSSVTILIPRVAVHIPKMECVCRMCILIGVTDEYALEGVVRMH